HPLCDFQFDPQQDLDVSTRHAEIRAVGDGYVLVDIGSTNGTYVNGVRIARERRLESGDEVAFGEFGPKVRLEIKSGAQPPARRDGDAARGGAAPNGAPVSAAAESASPPATRSIVTEARRVPGAATDARRDARRR